jgi:hypothetical protein
MNAGAPLSAIRALGLPSAALWIVGRRDSVDRSRKVRIVIPVTDVPAKSMLVQRSQAIT